MHTKSFTEIDEVESKVKEHQPDVLVCPLPIFSKFTRNIRATVPHAPDASESPTPHPTFGKISD